MKSAEEIHSEIIRMKLYLVQLMYMHADRERCSGLRKRPGRWLKQELTTEERLAIEDEIYRVNNWLAKNGDQIKSNKQSIKF